MKIFVQKKENLGRYHSHFLNLLFFFNFKNDPFRGNFLIY